MFSIIEIVFISFALAVDCFTASFALGVSHNRVRYDILFAIALSFGLFQALMPLFGWVCTMQLGEIAQSVDHWIAFVLLSYIGIKMIVDSGKDDDNSLLHKSNIVLMVLLLSVATSIDALAVGVTFSCMNYPTLSSILMPVAIIGLTSTLLSVVGYLLGIFLGKKTNFQIEIVGGAILIIIGLKILYEHLILQ